MNDNKNFTETALWDLGMKTLKINLILLILILEYQFNILQYKFSGYYVTDYD